MRVPRASWLHALAVERGGLVTLAVAAVYVWLTPTFIADGDNAEFSTLAMTGGVAHPPGYPLYVLYLRAMAWLPGGSGAHTAALATALLGAAVAFVLHAVCRAWGARPGTASIAVAIFAGGPIVLRLHTAAEVFALNNLIAALVLWLSAAAGPLQGAARTAALAFVAGLGLANQHTCVLLAPIGILGIVRGVREARDHTLRTITLGVTALAAGLVPYLYLLVATRTAASWGHPDSLASLVAHFTRADYGGIGAFSPVPGEIDPIRNIGAFVRTLLRSWLWLPAVLALATLGYRAARTAKGEPRAGWIMLAVSFLLAGPLLIARFNVPPDGFGLYIVHRFHVLPLVLLSIPCAIGVDSIVHWVERRRGRRFAALYPRDSLAGSGEGHRQPARIASQGCSCHGYGRRHSLRLVVRARGAQDPHRCRRGRANDHVALVPRVVRAARPVDRSICTRRRSAQCARRSPDPRDGSAAVRRDLARAHLADVRVLPLRRRVSSAAAGHSPAWPR